jgi:formiminotetrahydrofolate cyclodeaminase
MTTLIDMKMSAFLDELASGSPAPGGGSVAALAGALGAALTSMVCHLTVGKPGYEPIQNALPILFERCTKLRQEFTVLIDEDTAAYNTVVTAMKLPKTTDEEKATRRDALQVAFKKAADVPMQTARLCHDLLVLADDVAHKGNKNSITDAAVAALMAQAGLESAALNVRINLTSIKDPNYVTQTSVEILDLQQAAAERTKAIYDYVSSTLA